MNPIVFALPFGELLDHVVALVDEDLNAEAIVHSGERGFEYLSVIWIGGRVEGAGRLATPASIVQSGLLVVQPPYIT